MLKPTEFVDELKNCGFDFFTGVPDSLLKEFCACLTDKFAKNQHMIVANEGAAVGLATGYHLATGNPGLVYMQNSGTGNAINPLLSLADSDVYSIPMLIVIGWRGEPGVKDEPQHVKQGRVQQELLSAMGYPYEVLSQDMGMAMTQVKRLTSQMNETSAPVVLLVSKGTFDNYMPSQVTVEQRDDDDSLMTREQAIENIIAGLSDSTRIVSTTGMASREIFEIRERAGQGHHKDFLTVGSMGHVGMIALGLAGFQSKPVACIDGDGAALMHMGALPLIGLHAPVSFIHFVLNNGAHDSVGGQPTIGRQISFSRIAKESGYKSLYTVSDLAELQSTMKLLHNENGPTFVEILVKKGARSDLGRPTSTPIENKNAFMERI